MRYSSVKAVLLPGDFPPGGVLDGLLYLTGII